MKFNRVALALCVGLGIQGIAQAGPGHEGHIQAKGNTDVEQTFDIIHAKVTRDGTNLVFQQEVSGEIGSAKPTKTGKLAGSKVFSYVWPTSLDTYAVGFDHNEGILALALTAHPDFDDTPKYDENNDGKLDNDGNVWHSHWVVLTEDASCGPAGLKVKDIPKGATPRLPATWPGLPIMLDSPGYEPELASNTVTINVPMKELGFPTTFNFDGVTAGLQVNTSVHSPLLCVKNVHKVASGNLSLPGFVPQIELAEK